MVVDSRLCGGGNDGSCGGGCFLAIGCKKGGAKNQAQEGYCRLPIADCRLPIADCRLPIADCRLPIADSTATAFAVKLVWLVCVMSFPLVLCQWLLPPTKAIIPTKTRISSFFCKKICHSRPRLRGGRLRRESTAAGRRILRRRKPPVTGRGFYIPVILATAGIHPFAIFPFARKRKRRFIAENGKPLRRQSRR